MSRFEQQHKELNKFTTMMLLSLVFFLDQVSSAHFGRNATPRRLSSSCPVRLPSSPPPRCPCVDLPVAQQAKNRRLLPGDPHLFKKSAKIKSSVGMVQSFLCARRTPPAAPRPTVPGGAAQSLTAAGSRPCSSGTLSGGGDVMRQLRHIDYALTHTQTPLDEFDFTGDRRRLLVPPEAAQCAPSTAQNAPPTAQKRTANRSKPHCRVSAQHSRVHSSAPANG